MRVFEKSMHLWDANAPNSLLPGIDCNDNGEPFLPSAVIYIVTIRNFPRSNLYFFSSLGRLACFGPSSILGTSLNLVALVDWESLVSKVSSLTLSWW